MKEKHEPIDFRNHRYSSIDMARETGMSSEGLRFTSEKAFCRSIRTKKTAIAPTPS